MQQRSYRRWAETEKQGTKNEIFEAMAVVENVAADCLFVRKEKVIWRCRDCGHLHVGHAATLTQSAHNRIYTASC
jgi:rubrerythrin